MSTRAYHSQATCKKCGVAHLRQWRHLADVVLKPESRTGVAGYCLARFSVDRQSLPLAFRSSSTPGPRIPLTPGACFKCFLSIGWVSAHGSYISPFFHSPHICIVDRPAVNFRLPPISLLRHSRPSWIRSQTRSSTCRSSSCSLRRPCRSISFLHWSFGSLVFLFLQLTAQSFYRCFIFVLDDNTSHLECQSKMGSGLSTWVEVIPSAAIIRVQSQEDFQFSNVKFCFPICLVFWSSRFLTHLTCKNMVE